MLIFLYSGCMSIAPDSIAGEKERGTLATMLVTPMKRGNLAVGKILSLGTLALLSGLSSFIGTITSLPKMMGGAMDGMNTAVYGAGEYLALLGIILSTVLLFVSIISVVSAFSKNVKEATTYLVPFMVLVMLCGVAGMFGGGSAAFWVSLIPRLQQHRHDERDSFLPDEHAEPGSHDRLQSALYGRTDMGADAHVPLRAPDVQRLTKSANGCRDKNRGIFFCQTLVKSLQMCYHISISERIWIFRKR